MNENQARELADRLTKEGFEVYVDRMIGIHRIQGRGLVRVMNVMVMERKLDIKIVKEQCDTCNEVKPVVRIPCTDGIFRMCQGCAQTKKAVKVLHWFEIAEQNVNLDELFKSPLETKGGP